MDSIELSIFSIANLFCSCLFLFTAISESSFALSLSNLNFSDFPIIKGAYKMLGKPYIWGGRSYQGYDCSGLVQTTMNSLGFDFPRDAKKQAESNLLYEVAIEDDESDENTPKINRGREGNVRCY